MTASLLALLTLAQPAPDTAYFQQGVEYRIEARLDEETDVLHGRARLHYTNASTSTLDTLWFHQHLNAFRPNSAWARRETALGQSRFQGLGRDAQGYERFTRVEVAGRAVRPVYPGAPDSTVAAIPLPMPLRPGETVTVLMDWDARLSTVTRRQGRAGRHFDFAQWYPRIAVFDRGGWQVQQLLPQGEFYGEFGSFDVTLDVPADQVLAATGVPVEGDPGWQGVAAQPGGAIHYQRDAYPETPGDGLGLLAEPPAAVRKRVRWRAEDVHHFAWSADPEYIYEGGTLPRAGGGPEEFIAVHVLYRPGDSTWAGGVAVQRTQGALAWLQQLFGPYPYPQITNLHRLESGGTEFPMLVMNGSPSEGLIVHEVTHQYLHGILANNEWRQGWLDEGFTSFVDTWHFEERGVPEVWDGTLESVAELDGSGESQPVDLPGAEYRDPRVYSIATYSKASLVFRMLRDLVGEDTMRGILRTYYERHRLRHVTGADFEAVAEEVSGRDLSWFFDQWLRTTATLDYYVEEASTERLPDGRWRTRVEVVRAGEAWMPVELQVNGETNMLTSRQERQTVEVTTSGRPDAVTLDPHWLLLDVDRENNRVEL